MADWTTVTREDEALAAFAAARLTGLVAFLATVRADGSPRLHPVTPIIGGGQLFVFMEPTSPKGHDLRRDGRYALHSGVEDNDGGGGEVAVRGRASAVLDPAVRALAVAAARYRPSERYVLFSLAIDEVLATRYVAGAPVRQHWPSPASSSAHTASRG